MANLTRQIAARVTALSSMCLSDVNTRVNNPAIYQQPHTGGANMKERRLIATGVLAAAALVGTSVLAQPSSDFRNGGHGNTGNGRCQLHSDNNRIQHVVYIQFYNVHFRRDLQNIPSDLAQMSNLRH